MNLLPSVDASSLSWLPQPRARPSEIAASVVSVERTLAILDDFTVMDRGLISISVHNPIFADTYIHAVPGTDSDSVRSADHDGGLGIGVGALS